jgi:flagellar basal body-associated protein FliL
MAQKVNKKIIILIGLLVINLVGYITASYYFADSDTPKLFSLDFLHSAAHSSTRMLNTERILNIGLELFRNIGN